MMSHVKITVLLIFRMVKKNIYLLVNPECDVNLSITFFFFFFFCLVY